MGNLTLKDIAASLNISITTVSKALKDYPDVSPKTKQRVREYVKTVNFKPNSHAAFLRTRETKLVGIIVPSLSHYFFNNIINGLIEDAQKQGFMVIILCSHESFETEVIHIQNLLHQNVDGIFLSLAQNTNDFSHLNNVIERNTTLILFDKISKIVDCSKVVIDDRNAAFRATEHLIKNGRKRIAHFRGNLMPQNSIDRFLGYKDALKKYDIPFDKNLVISCEKADELSGINAVQKIIDEKIDIDGVFAITDLTAIGAMQHFKKKQYKIPEDIAIVGFSNWLVSGYTTPSLTTIDQPGKLIGKEVMELFIKENTARKKKAPIIHQTISVPAPLIERESS